MNPRRATLTLSATAMPLIVDTYNVLHVIGVLPPEEAGIDLRGLIGLIQHSRYRDERVELICDGAPRDDVPPGKRRSVIVRYAGPNRLADDAIAQMVRKSTIPKRLTIVSSDNEVVRAARRRRCRVLSSEAFLRQLANDVRMPVQGPAAPPGPKRMKPAQVDAWQRYFAIDDDAVDALETEAEREARRIGPKPRTKPARSAPREESSGPAQQSDNAPSGSRSIQPLFPPEILKEAERLARQLNRLDRAQAHDENRDEGDET